MEKRHDVKKDSRKFLFRLEIFNLCANKDKFYIK